MINYRPDIDGLRSVAVVSVILFHFFPELLPGGFVGVDIFFVISGFLITSIINDDFDKQKFSIVVFYKKRVLRIFPALFLVLSVSYAVGWFTLTQGDFSLLGKHIFGGAFFISNILLWRESGYFDISSQLKPLLHLWSLGVEEQFYLLWPLILMLLSNTKIKKSSVAFFIMMLSLCFSIATMHSSSGINYYSPLTRAWELMAGATIATLNLNKNRSLSRGKLNALSIAGFIFISVSLAFINESMAFPGYIAALPVIGAVIVILSSGGIINRILELRPFVYVGLVSYPLYLWHWPVYFYSKVIIGKELSSTCKISLILISFLLAVLTHELFEKQIKKIRLKKESAIALILSVFSIGFMGLLTHLQNGIPSRKVNMSIIAYTSITSPYSFFKFKENIRDGVCHSVEVSVAIKNRCLSEKKDQILIWGDSYAASLYQGINYEIKNKKMNAEVSQMTDGNGPPFFLNNSYTDAGKNIATANTEKLQMVKQLQPNVIVITWMVVGKNAIKDKESAADNLLSLVAMIKSASPSSEVIVIGPFPEWKETLLRQNIQYYKENGSVLPSESNYGLREDPFAWDRVFKEKFSGYTDLTYISAIDSLCNKSGCITRYGDGPENLIAVDWGHLSAAGSRLLINRISGELFKNLN